MPAYNLKNEDKFVLGGNMVDAPHSIHLTTVTDTNIDEVQGAM
jgi:hypothetical protein